MDRPASIRITEDPESVFEEVLRSLESHRPAKAERDILDKIQERFGLLEKPGDWPAQLASQTKVEEFLAYTLQLISPFVEMVLEIYAFLSDYVSTTGGRTTHFEINSEALSEPMRFENVNFPKRVRWISAWAAMDTDLVVTDWNAIGDALRLDNGIFYGKVGDVRFLQSLIIARRQGRLSTRLRTLGDRVEMVVRRAVRAWFRRAMENQESAGAASRKKPVFLVFVPALHDLLTRRRIINSDTVKRWSVPVDLGAITEAAPVGLRLEETFAGIDPRRHLTLGALTEEGRPNWRIAAAVFFCAFWRLEESQFREVASLLTEHEERDDILVGGDLDRSGETLGRLLIDHLEQLIVPTGDTQSSTSLIRLRLELLLLPYWKDRWFLFEVWTLLRTLRHALRLGARVDLVGVGPIRDKGVEGETWNLPTQKAKDPVARIHTDGSELLVWFQRETRRYDEDRHMEPDVRITLPRAPFPDIAIIECKDRIKFAGKRVEDLARGYLTGSAARVVWIVNYEEGREGSEERFDRVIEDRSLGFAYKFRPGEVGQLFEKSLDVLLREHLHLASSTAEPEEDYLVIDISGSMAGKRISHLGVLRSFADSEPSRVKLWSNAIVNADEAQRRTLFEVGSISGYGMGQGIESHAALKAFIDTLSVRARIRVITDDSGRAQVEAIGQVGGRELTIISV